MVASITHIPVKDNNEKNRDTIMKALFDKTPKNYNSLEIDLSKLAGEITSVFSTFTTERITEKLEVAKDTDALLTAANDSLLTTVPMEYTLHSMC